MRIIAGIYRGRVLKSPPDSKTRPTSDRLRETLFNIIQPKIHAETLFLDLCAGTGAIGIEAISRGAGFVQFVDKSRKSSQLIEANIQLLGIPHIQTNVSNREALDFVKRTDKKFDIVFFDPPYKEDYTEVLNHFGTTEFSILMENGIFIAEHSAKTLLPDQIGQLIRWRIVKQGDSSLSFYERS